MPLSTLPTDLRKRIQQHAREWRLTITETFETETSVISFVSRRGLSLVLKVVKREGDEWNAGEVLSAFDGHGVVRVYEHTAGAMLLERLQPGVSLSKISNDEEATEILVRVIERMSAHEIPNACPTVEDWGKGFERFLTSGDKQVARQLAESAQQEFTDLCASQSKMRLLHGDFHHYNVVYDSNRSWLAIDPKGVVGELEYEIGAVLRNPFERPELYLSRTIIERRLRQFATELRLDYQRMLCWAFAQAVLSAIWEIEDGFTVDLTNPSLRLAEVVRTMIKE